MLEEGRHRHPFATTLPLVGFRGRAWEEKVTSSGKIECCWAGWGTIYKHGLGLLYGVGEPTIKSSLDSEGLLAMDRGSARVGGGWAGAVWGRKRNQGASCPFGPPRSLRFWLCSFPSLSFGVQTPSCSKGGNVHAISTCMTQHTHWPLHSCRRTRKNDVNLARNIECLA